MAKFSSRSINALRGVHPDLVALMEAAIEDTPIDFTVIEGVRTKARQKALYAKGRTKKGNIVTYANGTTRKSNHQKRADGYGHAVDIYPYINGRIDFNDVKSLRIIANHIKKVASKLNISITWGGDWKRPFDPPHFQLN